jgi:predicted nucleic acid-binding protein
MRSKQRPSKLSLDSLALWVAKRHGRTVSTDKDFQVAKRIEQERNTLVLTNEDQ